MKTNRSLSLSPVQRLTLLGVLAALTLALTALENALPPLPLPFARLGLANLAITAALSLMGLPSALLLTAAKALFALLTRGVTAALMSGSGTLLAVLVMAALLPLERAQRLTFVGVAVGGAAAHNGGQLLCAAWLLGGGVWSYAPLLLLLAAGAGVVTGLVLNVVLPRLPLRVLQGR